MTEDDPEIEWAYRYEDRAYAKWDPWDEYDGHAGSFLQIDLQTFRVLRHTAKGIWIDHYGTPKFINLEKNKRFALPSRKEALESFIARKQRQAEILRHQIKRAHKALELAGNMLEGKATEED